MERKACTYKAACEVDTDGAPVLPKGDIGEGVDAHPPRVVVVARNGHVVRGVDVQTSSSEGETEERC